MKIKHFKLFRGQNVRGVGHKKRLIFIGPDIKILENNKEIRRNNRKRYHYDMNNMHSNIK